MIEFCVGHVRKSVIWKSGKWFSSCKNFGDINNALVKALYSAGYDSKLSYFSFEKGFVIATQLEQINENGSLRNGNHRWIANVGSQTNEGFSFRNYFKALMTARPGYYRSFVFIISSSIYKLSGDYYSKDLLSKFLNMGYSGLSPLIAGQKINSDLRYIVFVYEYKKMENSNESNLLLDGPTASQQLKSSLILDKLNNGN